MNDGVVTHEPVMTINGVDLSEGQAMTVRVAISNFVMLLGDNPDVLGKDEHGKRMRSAYLDRLRELIGLMHL